MYNKKQRAFVGRPILSGRDEIRKYAESILKDFDYVYSGYSESNYGTSIYYRVMKDENDLDGIKVRFSDHSVTNKDRIENEVHFSLVDIESPKTKFMNNQRFLELRKRLGDKSVVFGEISYKNSDGKTISAWGYKEKNNPIIRYAGGGKVIAYKKDLQKFNKIGITDKYTIEAISEIGLQGINFDKKSVEDKISAEFQNLLKTANDYIISEDSNAITKTIENEIQTRFNQGDTQENINSYKLMLDNPSERKRYISNYAETQKNTLDEWISYLKQSEYSDAIKYLILKAVLKYNYDYKINDYIKRSNTTIRNFTPFDAGTLSELVNSNSDELLKDYVKKQVENSVNILKSKELVNTSSGGKWIKFDGGSKTPEEVKLKNSKELSQLVQNTYWCTKTNSKSQLDGGDFYVYVTEINGEVFPRIAIRMDEDKVGEVRGNKSSAQDLEDDMIPIAKEFLEKNIPNDSGKKWLDGIEFNEKAIELYNKINTDGLFENSVEDFIKLKSNEKKYLLDYADRNGHIVRLEKLIEEQIKLLPNQYYGENEIIAFYDYLSDIYDYLSDISVDLSVVKIILGKADFRDSQVTDLRNLTTIGGKANFENSQVTNLGNLTTIGGNANFANSKITDLGNLTTISGDAYFGHSQVNNLGNLTNIGGDAYFGHSQVTDLGNLTTIVGSANFENSQVTDLGNLNTIGGFADFKDSKITNLGNLKTIGEGAFFTNSQVTDLGNLTTIGGDANFVYSQVTNLGNLKTIGGDADFRKSKITDLGNLTTIGGYADFQDSKVTDLGNLKTIGGSAFFTNSQVTDLGNLNTIGGFADFKDSKITNLGNLKTIGEYADFEHSQVNNLGNLTNIGGDAYFGHSQVTNLGNLTTIDGYANFEKSQVTNLGNLKTIGGDANFGYSQVDNLGNLNTIGGSAFFGNSQVTDLGNLKTIGGNASFENSKITDLGNLNTIGGDAFFTDSQVTDLGNLNTIGGFADFVDSKVTDLGNLNTIGGDANFGISKITDLGNLTTIGGFADFVDSKITDLGNLTTIGGDANFEKSKITDLGNLTTIGGDAYFQKSKITNLGNLTTIGGDAYFEYSQVTDFGKLEKVKKIIPKEFEIAYKKYIDEKSSKKEEINQLTTEKMTSKEILNRRKELLEEALKNYKSDKNRTTSEKLVSEIVSSLDTLYELDEKDKEVLFNLILIANNSIGKKYKTSLINWFSWTSDDTINKEKVKIQKSVWQLLNDGQLVSKQYPLPIKFEINPNNIGLTKIFDEITSSDDLRPIMNGVEIIGNEATGTDAHKLIHVIANRTGEFEDGVYALNKNSVNEKGQKMDGNYPNWLSILPKECTNSTIVNLPFLYTIVNSFYKNNLLTKTQNAFGIKMYNSMTDHNEVVSFDAEYFLQVSKSLLLLGLREVKICWQTSNRAVLIFQPNVELSGYNSDKELKAINFGLIMPLFNISDRYNLILEIKEPLEIDYTYADNSKGTIKKSDIFIAKQPLGEVKGVLKIKEPKKEVKSQAEDEKKFLEDKILAFETMKDLTEDKDEINYLNDKILAFKDMLDLI